MLGLHRMCVWATNTTHVRAHVCVNGYSNECRWMISGTAVPTALREPTVSLGTSTPLLSSASSAVITCQAVVVMDISAPVDR